MRRYRHHKYTWSKPWGSVQHRWEFVHIHGALHFNVTLVKDYDPSAGLEYHYLKPQGREDEAPHHLNCPLTGGRCWHDGTSLWAIEHVWPMVEPMLRNGDHEAIFRFLEGIADRHFFPEPEAARV